MGIWTMPCDLGHFFDLAVGALQLGRLWAKWLIWQGKLPSVV